MNSRQLSAIDFYSMYGGFLFLGMFLGILFLSATTLIIYYKQVSGDTKTASVLRSCSRWA